MCKKLRSRAQYHGRDFCKEIYEDPLEISFLINLDQYIQYLGVLNFIKKNFEINLFRLINRAKKCRLLLILLIFLNKLGTMKINYD